MKIVIEIDEGDYEYIKNGCIVPIKYDNHIYNAIRKGTPFPENATNGNMIKAMFPNVDVKERNNGYEVYFGVGTAIQFFNHQWWNAPYKGESEVEE